MSAVPKNPPLPVYDPATDGNVFAWIVRVSPQIRARRNGTAALQRASRRSREWLDNRPLAGAQG